MSDAEISEMVELSINSVVGLTLSKTMKVKGTIAQQEVVVMIDCGATHNFISTELVRRLGIPLVSTRSYGVLMGTGLTVQGSSICKGVVLTLQNIEVVEDFLPLELGSADVILGMQWLESLGGMQVNWKNLTMHFKVGGVGVSLQVDPSLSQSLVSLKSLWKDVQEQGGGILVELGSIGVVDTQPSAVIPSII